MAALRKGTLLEGQLATYEIQQSLSGGGFGLTYLAKTVQPRRSKRRVSLPDRVVVKILNVRRIEPTGDLLSELGKLLAQFHFEYWASKQLRGLKNVAGVIDYGTHYMKILGERLPTPFTVQPYISGCDLDVYCKGRCRPKSDLFRGIRDPKEFFDLAKKLCQAVLDLHQRGVVHGDLTVHNVRLDQNRKPVLIDLGQARFVRFQLSNANTRRGGPPHVPPEGSGTIQGDLYSLGCLLYYLATGQSKPPTQPDNDVLKRDLDESIQRCNPDLHRAPGVADVIGRCLRLSSTSRPAHAQMVVDDIEAFSGENSTALAKDDVQLDTRIMRRVLAPMFQKIGRSLVKETKRLISNMKAGVLDLYGDHETIVSGMTEYLSFLDGEDEYLALSIPQFWRTENMGIDGRFLAMNKLAAQRGARVGRVFVVTQQDRGNNEVEKILQAQARLVKELSQQGIEVNNRRMGYFVGVVVKTEEERNKLIQSGKHVGVLAKGRRGIVVAAMYRDDGLITSLQFRSNRNVVDDSRKVIEQMIEESTPLLEYLQGTFGG